MSNFQYILLGIFIFFILAGVVVFASLGGMGGGAGSTGATVTIWGSLPQSTMEAVIKQFGINAKYKEEAAGTFETDLVNALASGAGPDIALLPQNLLLKEGNKIYPIPSSAYPIRQLQSTFIQEGNVFTSSSTILGLPFVVDPLVMYWNQDLFANAGIALPPTHWDEFYNLVPKLTIKDQDSTIHQSTVSFGGYANISQAKDILATLLLQTGDTIVGTNDTGTYVSTLIDRNSTGNAVASDVLNFYTGFTDPLKTQYSWNDSLPTSKNYFLAGNLALYFGYASELSDLRNKNPNLNFSVATIPQARDVSANSSLGNLQALVIMNNSIHKADSFATMLKLTAPDAIAFLSTLTKLPPVRLDLLATKPTDGASASFYTAALQSKGWLDPDPVATDKIFGDMVQSITSGQARTDDAVNSASLQLGELLRTYANSN